MLLAGYSYSYLLDSQICSAGRPRLRVNKRHSNAYIIPGRYACNLSVCIRGSAIVWSIVYRLHLCLGQALSGCTLISYEEYLEIGSQSRHESNAHYRKNSHRYQHFWKGDTLSFPFEYKFIHNQPALFAQNNTDGKNNLDIAIAPAMVSLIRSAIPIFRLTTLLSQAMSMLFTPYQAYA